MDEKQPKNLDTKKFESLAIRYIKDIFEANDWFFRVTNSTTDFGIEAEVEIKDVNKVTGKVFICQIMTKNFTSFNEGYFPVKIESSNWHNWKKLNFPVIAFLYNPITNKIYWTLPLGFTPQKESKVVTLKFSQAHCVNHNELKSIITTWQVPLQNQNILREIPYFHNMFLEELEPLIDWGDPWCDVDEEYNMKARVFYAHVLSLRTSLGLRNDKIFPLDYWLIRNQGIWDEPQNFFYSTISELLAYIKYYYEEAIDKLKIRLESVEKCFENFEILNYDKLHMSTFPKNNNTITWHHPLKDNESFHGMIESSLSQIGYEHKVIWRNKK